jgi:hypothetical protein
VIGESCIGGEIGRAEVGDAVTADHERIAPPAAEILSEAPIGAGARERKTQ